MLETGKYATIRQFARAERINPSYVSRVLRVTLLAPATVEAIVEGRHPIDMALAELVEPIVVSWAPPTRERLSIQGWMAEGVDLNSNVLCAHTTNDPRNIIAMLP